MQVSENITPPEHANFFTKIIHTLANYAHSVWRFYYEGFRDMTVGKKLWTIILIKLFIMFAILKLFFFPDILKRDYDNDTDRAAHVRHELSHQR